MTPETEARLSEYRRAPRFNSQSGPSYHRGRDNQPSARGRPATAGVSDQPFLSPMATTQQHSQQRELHPWTTKAGETEAEKVEAWFGAQIWTDRTVCSNCFARLQTSEELVVDDWDNTVEETTYTDAAEKGFDVVAKGRIGETTVRHEDGQVEGLTHKREHTAKYHAHERTTCGECGSVGGLPTSDAISASRAHDCVPRLAARLEELGHAVDEQRIHATVSVLKRDPETRVSDKALFARAAAMGVKHG